jgi:DNA-binding GntR family transcriptional regulator
MSDLTERKSFRLTLSEQIKEQLIEDIFHHKYQAGDKIVESALAKELGVSQASVREALRSLIAMGFLESEPYKGITVRELTHKDLWEVYTVRAALESLAGELAAHRITDEQLDRLSDITEQMIEAGKAGDIAKRSRLNIEFHRTVMKASGNKLILKLFEFMQFDSWSLMTSNLSTMDSVEIAVRHRDVIDALRSRDPKHAAERMREHIETAGKPIAENLAQGHEEFAEQHVQGHGQE